MQVLKCYPILHLEPIFSHFYSPHYNCEMSHIIFSANLEVIFVLYLWFSATLFFPNSIHISSTSQIIYHAYCLQSNQSASSVVFFIFAVIFPNLKRDNIQFHTSIFSGSHFYISVGIG